VKFGLNVVPVHPDQLGEIAMRAEDLGYESVWVGEHVVTPVTLAHAYPGTSGRPPFAPDSRFIEPFTALAYLAALTRAVRLGTGILILPLHSPVPVARAIATLDVLSGGRVSLGFGVGWMREEFDAVGQDFSDRGRRTDEMIAVLDSLFTKKRPSFAGQYYQLPEMGFEPKPVQQPRPPFLVGGTSPAALRRAAALGDGWYGGQDPPEKLAVTVAELRRLRERSGTADRPFEITALLGWGQGFDPDLVGRYRAAGVDRLVATPWKRSREAAAAIDQFARDARLETDLTTGEGPR
jgi:probable F420-dependent oxidoreductase